MEKQGSLGVHLNTTILYMLTLFLGVIADDSMHTTDYGLAESHESADRETMTMAAQSFPSIDEKALLRKIDFRVIPILFIIYVAAFLDR